MAMTMKAGFIMIGCGYCIVVAVVYREWKKDQNIPNFIPLSLIE